MSEESSYYKKTMKDLTAHERYKILCEDEKKQNAEIWLRRT